MTLTARWTLLALSLSAAGCPGSSDGGKLVDCSWATGANCYQTVVNAARGCVNDALTGSFNPTATVCTYPDGVSVEFDPARSPTVAAQTFGPWDFTVLTSTATPCARYVDTSDSSWTFTSAAGTFTADASSDLVVFTCPDGSHFGMKPETALSCISDLPGWTHSISLGTIWFGMVLPRYTSVPLWRCQ